MQEINVSLESSRAVIRRADGAGITSACAPGAEFLTATELLLASLGSCITASLQPLFQRHNLDTATLHIALNAVSENLQDGISVHLRIPRSDTHMQNRLRRAAENCTVLRALNVCVTFHWLYE